MLFYRLWRLLSLKKEISKSRLRVRTSGSPPLNDAMTMMTQDSYSLSVELTSWEGEGFGRQRNYRHLRHRSGTKGLIVVSKLRDSILGK
jgi:hypothetical protein